MSRAPAGIALYNWDGSGWSPGVTLPAFANPTCSTPGCYLDLLTGDGMGILGYNAFIGRDGGGVSVWSGVNTSTWLRLDTPPTLGAPFMDQSPSPDCPFGGRGSGNGDCLGASPAYYETMQVADVDGRPGDELLARASDGVRVRHFTSTLESIRPVTYDDPDTALNYGSSWVHNTGVSDSFTTSPVRWCASLAWR